MPPDAAVPVAQTTAATLRVRLEGAGLVAVSSPDLWGAEDRAEALTSARALRNWLDEAPNRHALYLLPPGAVDAGTPTGLDREIAYALAPYERSGQLRFGTLDGSAVANAPRLSVLKGVGAEASVDAFCASQDAAAALAGPLEGVSHLFFMLSRRQLACVGAGQRPNVAGAVGWAYRTFARLPLPTGHRPSAHTAVSRRSRAPCRARNRGSLVRCSPT